MKGGETKMSETYVAIRQTWSRRYLTLNPERINNVFDLKNALTEYADSVIYALTSNAPIRRRLINWQKINKIIKRMIDIFVDNHGEEILKEKLVVSKIKKLPEKDICKRLPEIIADIFGSLDEYGNFGKRIRHTCIFKLHPILTNTGFSIFERLYVKSYLQLMIQELMHTGLLIVRAVEKTKKERNKGVAF